MHNERINRMKTRAAAKTVAALILATTVIPAVSGCQAKTELTKEEEANFKGGPMPADFNPSVPVGQQAGGAGAAGGAAAPPGPGAAGAPAGTPPGPAAGR